MIFAACQVGPGGIPRMRAKAAETAVSVARPASTTSAPARSACSIGSWPIMPTMCAHLVSVAASSGSPGGRAWTRPLSRAAVSRSARCSLKIFATVRSSPSSTQMAVTMSATQFTPESVPLVPQEPTTSGMRALLAAARSRRRSRRTARSVVFATPAPR